MSLFGDDDDILYDEPDFDAHDQKPSESLSDPKSMSFCIGHETQEKLFLELFKKKSVPHAMIFSGLKGIGKTTMAFRLARFLLKNGNTDENQDNLFGGGDLPEVEYDSLNVGCDDAVFTRVASGGHADLLHIARAYDSTKNKYDAALKVEALRKIEPFLRKTSSAGGWRVVIIEDADTMNRSAQNAILKILEEPPKDVLIILVAHRIGALIPTIRSRSRVFNFEPLSQDNLLNLLSINDSAPSTHELETIYALSQGSVGSATGYLDGGGLEMLANILTHLEEISNWKWGDIHALSSQLSGVSNDKEYRLFAELMPWVFRQALYAKLLNDGALPPYLNSSPLQKFVNNASLERLIDITDKLKEHFERIDFSNLDRRDAVRASFLVISE